MVPTKIDRSIPDGAIMLIDEGSTSAIAHYKGKIIGPSHPNYILAELKKLERSEDKKWSIRIRDGTSKLFDVSGGSMIHQMLTTEPGTKLTLTFHDIYGEPYEEKVKFMGDVQQHGYFHPSGYWSLYDRSDSEAKICFEILVRPFKKQYVHWMKLEYRVKAIKIGW